MTCLRRHEGLHPLHTGLQFCRKCLHTFLMIWLTSISLWDLEYFLGTSFWKFFWKFLVIYFSAMSLRKTQFHQSVALCQTSYPTTCASQEFGMLQVENWQSISIIFLGFHSYKVNANSPISWLPWQLISKCIPLYSWKIAKFLLLKKMLSAWTHYLDSWPSHAIVITEVLSGKVAIEYYIISLSSFFYEISLKFCFTPEFSCSPNRHF